jgi:predicted enzyme related to lactoylglutathione lyase
MELTDNHINYVEFKAMNLGEIKRFYSAAFAWKFADYGPNYIAFSESGLQGGFERSKTKVTKGVLVILYHSNLTKVKERIIEAGGKIVKDIFSFPGGRRFHFEDPAGNELAVWSE